MRCPDCDGTGEIDDGINPDAECPGCGGWGHVSEDEYPITEQPWWNV